MSEGSASRLEANASPRDSGNRSLSRSPNYQLTWSRSRSRSPTSHSRYSRSASPPPISRSPPARRMDGHVHRSRSPVDRGNGHDDSDWKRAEKEIQKKEYELEQLRARVTYARELENERKKQHEMRRKLERLQAESPSRLRPSGGANTQDQNNNRHKQDNQVHVQPQWQRTEPNFHQMRSSHHVNVATGRASGGQLQPITNGPPSHAPPPVPVPNVLKTHSNMSGQQKPRVSKFDSPPRQTIEKQQGSQQGSFAISPLGYQFGTDGILYYDAAMAETREAELDHLSPEEYCTKLGVQSDFVTNRVYVRNLDYRVTHEQLFQIFSMVGKVRNVMLKINSETGKNLGTALVYYYDRKCTVRAIAVTHELKLFDRKIKVVMGNPPGPRNVPLNTQIGNTSAHTPSERNIHSGNSYDYDTRKSEYYPSIQTTSQMPNYSSSRFTNTSNTVPLPMVLEENDYGPQHHAPDSSANVVYRSPTHKPESPSLLKPIEIYDPATRSVEQMHLPPPLMSIPIKTPPLSDQEEVVLSKPPPQRHAPAPEQLTAASYPVAEAQFSQNALPIPVPEPISQTGTAAAVSASPANTLTAPAIQLLQNCLSAVLLEQQARSRRSAVNQQPNPTASPTVPPVSSLHYSNPSQKLSTSPFPSSVAVDSDLGSVLNFLQGKVNVILGDKATAPHEQSFVQQYPHHHHRHQQQLPPLPPPPPPPQQHVPQTPKASLPIQQVLPPMAIQQTEPALPDIIDPHPNDTYALPWDSYVQRGMIKNRFPVLVTNLPASCHQSTLKEYFDQHVGEVMHVEIERDLTNDHLALATVFFSSPALSLKAFNTQNRHFICGRQVEIKYAVE